MSDDAKKPKLTMEDAREIARRAMQAKSDLVRRQDAPLCADSFTPPETK